MVDSSPSVSIGGDDIAHDTNKTPGTMPNDSTCTASSYYKLCRF